MIVKACLRSKQVSRIGAFDLHTHTHTHTRGVSLGLGRLSRASNPSAAAPARSGITRRPISVDFGIGQPVAPVLGFFRGFILKPHSLVGVPPGNRPPYVTSCTPRLGCMYFCGNRDAPPDTANTTAVVDPPPPHPHPHPSVPPWNLDPSWARQDFQKQLEKREKLAEEEGKKLSFRPVLPTASRYTRRPKNVEQDKTCILDAADVCRNI